MPSKDPVANCFTSGLYCSDPNFIYQIQDGREIIAENIRQKCVYNWAHKEKKEVLKYVKYMNLFYTTCMNKISPKFNKDCHDEVMKSLSIPTEWVDKCYEDSFLFSTRKIITY